MRRLLVKSFNAEDRASPSPCVVVGATFGVVFTGVGAGAVVDGPALLSVFGPLDCAGVVFGMFGVVTVFDITVSTPTVIPAEVVA